MENNIKLSFIDKITLPFSKGYKGFKKEIETTPAEQFYMDGERKFSKLEQKYMKLYRLENGIKEIDNVRQSREEYIKQLNLKDITVDDVRILVSDAIYKDKFEKIEYLKYLSPKLNENEIVQKINASDELKFRFKNNVDELEKIGYNQLPVEIDKLAGKVKQEPNYIYLLDDEMRQKVETLLELKPNISSISLSSQEHKKLANLWQEQINIPISEQGMAKGMTADEIAEKVSNHYSLYEYLSIEKIKEKLSSIDGNDEVKKAFSGVLTPKQVEIYYKEKRKEIITEISYEQLADNYKTIEHLRKELKKLEKIYNKMEQKFDLEIYLRNQMKYLGFGESEKLHKELKKGLESNETEFVIKTSSEKTTFGKSADFTLNFKKTENGAVFLNSYDANLTNSKGDNISHRFKVKKEDNITAKEAINLLEGRAVKTNLINSKTNEKEPAFIKLKLNEDKNEYGNYKLDVYSKNYGVDTVKIVEKSNLIFDKPEYKDFTIKSLEKGNLAPVKFIHEDKVIEGKVMLNPQYKTLNLYDNDMNRVNTNKPIKGLEMEDNQKAQVKEQSIKRGH